MDFRSPAMAASPSPSAANTNRYILRPPAPPPPPFNTSPSTVRASIPMLLPVFILFFVLACFLSVFLFRDILHFTTALLTSRDGRGNADRNSTSGNGAGAAPSAGATVGDQAAHRGLDPVILASFPKLPYSAVRGLQEGKCGMECAVCLGEFSGSDVIRLLTVCCHAFHPLCIDSWLAAHSTCPVCRSDLESPPDEAAVLAVRKAVGGGERRENHSISIEDDGGGGEGDSRRITKSPSPRLPAEVEGC